VVRKYLFKVANLGKDLLATCPLQTVLCPSWIQTGGSNPGGGRGGGRERQGGGGRTEGRIEGLID